MAKCGITVRYPVRVVIVHDDGSRKDSVVIGDAETLSQALAMVVSQGFDVRDSSDGGASRFIVDGADGQRYFLVTTYPGSP